MLWPGPARHADLMTHTRSRNGLDVALLQEAVDELRKQPESATVTIRTRHRWDDGFAVDGYADEIEEAGEVSVRAFTFRTDWPPEIGGRDTGPSPGEAILGALGGCVAMTYVTKAATRGVDMMSWRSPLRPVWICEASSNWTQFEQGWRART
jgi:hypothetical protein